MEKHSLENCIDSLKRLRDVYSGQLDTSVLEELNSVITALETAHESQLDQTGLGQLSVRAIQVIASVVSLVSNLKEWMK
jgi:hypothetical protein